MATTTETTRVPSPRDAATLARIEKLSEDEFKDLKELLKLYRNSDSDEDRAEIQKSLSELLYPEGLTETVDPSGEISRETRDKLELYQCRVGKAIRDRREKLDMTQEELAKKADLQQSHLSRLENGQHRASRRTIRRIAKVLRTKADSLDPGFDHSD